MSFEFRLDHNGKTSGRVTMMVNATSVVTQHRLDPNASHREAILYQVRGVTPLPLLVLTTLSESQVL